MVLFFFPRVRNKSVPGQEKIGLATTSFTFAQWLGIPLPSLLLPSPLQPRRNTDGFLSAGSRQPWKVGTCLAALRCAASRLSHLQPQADDSQPLIRLGPDRRQMADGFRCALRGVPGRTGGQDLLPLHYHWMYCQCRSDAILTARPFLLEGFLARKGRPEPGAS